MPYFTVRGPVALTVAVVATTTWNPADAGGNTLSNGNLTVTENGGGGVVDGVRSIASASSGKKYWEVHVDSISTTNPEFGIAISSANLSSFMGATAGSIGWLADNRVFLGGSQVATLATWATGNTLSGAVDFGNNRIWFRVNGGNWNNDGAADPATNTNGIDISSMTAGAKFPAVQTFSTADAFTANFGGSAYTQSVPSGFVNW